MCKGAKSSLGNIIKGYECSRVAVGKSEFFDLSFLFCTDPLGEALLAFPCLASFLALRTRGVNRCSAVTATTPSPTKQLSFNGAGFQNFPPLLLWEKGAFHTTQQLSATSFSGSRGLQ